MKQDLLLCTVLLVLASHTTGVDAIGRDVSVPPFPRRTRSNPDVAETISRYCLLRM
jgi:hypothetical protein